MYKIMLVDDDYPVIELLEESISWKELGLTLAGTYENGVAALEAAERDMPDILVTDIGMPKMNGLELICRLKERNPLLRVAILSCHSEFNYAKRAMQLQVQDYIVKDTLNPDDLQPVLKRLIISLDEERKLNIEQHRLRHIVDRSRGAMREKWIQSAVQQPILMTETWNDQLEEFGLPVEGRLILPVISIIDDICYTRSRFASDEILRFAVSNVIDEVIRDVKAEAVLFPYSVKEWVILHSFRPTLTINGYDETRRLLEYIQDALRRALEMSMSFIVGNLCTSSEKLKQSLRGLLSNEEQRFYMRRSEITSYQTSSIGDGALFAFYDEAIESFRENVMRRDVEGIKVKAAEWVAFIQERKFPQATVKDWVLKLLLDIRLKQQSLQYFRSTQSAESLNKDVAEIGSLLELQDWFTRQLLLSISAVLEGTRTQRKEMLDAFEYVSLHLDKRIGLEEIAEYLHLNASYFSRLFKKVTGETFIEYVIRRKMDRAKELLDQTTHSVLKICELLGYDNQSYFIKLFKGYTGMTPMDYRNRSHNVQ